MRRRLHVVGDLHGSGQEGSPLVRAEVGTPGSKRDGNHFGLVCTRLFAQLLIISSFKIKLV